MQHLHALQRSAVLRGAVTEEESNFTADPEIQARQSGERQTGGEREKTEGRRVGSRDERGARWLEAGGKKGKRGSECSSHEQIQ